MTIIPPGEGEALGANPRRRVTAKLDCPEAALTESIYLRAPEHCR